MEKFDSQKHSKLIDSMPFSYVSTAVYLDFCAYVLKANDEELVVKEDVVSHNFPYFFLPRKKENWECMSASMVSKEDIQKIKDSGIEVSWENPTETEFIYSTQNLLNPAKGYKNKIKRFENNHKYTILKKYDKEKILSFYSLWEGQKEDLNNIFAKESNDFFFYCLNNLEKYNIRQIYVEVDEKLVGFVWGVKHSNDKWVSIHIKSDYQYRGLNRFLNHEITKEFADTKIVSLGTGCQDEGLIQNKKELGPIEEKQYYYVATTGKIQKPFV